MLKTTSLNMHTSEVMQHDKLRKFSADERHSIDGPESEVLFLEKATAESKQCRFHHASLKTKLNPEL